jgi:hypothetical protein
MQTRNRWVGALAALVVLAVGSTTQAQTKPFKVTGAGIVDYVPVTPGVPVFHWAVGEATDLGRYYGEGKVQLDEFTGPTTADFSSAVPFVFTAANGDKLAFTYGDTENGAAQAGHVELVPVEGGEFVAVWLAEFNPVPSLSTGRFAKVVGGSFTMLAITEPFVLGATDPVAYSWSGKGTLTFAKKK